jgi:O-acetylhomoserine/O-acetylserine sulfhydrylase-like pyridoxal-dependent enzyme
VQIAFNAFQTIQGLETLEIDQKKHSEKMRWL